MDLDRDVSEFIGCCIAREVRFLVVGGYAVAAHGYPRFTQDLDVWVWIDASNARRLVQALTDFGFGDVGLGEEDFLEPEMVVQLGYPPKRIDLLTGIDGVTFDDCWPERVEFDVAGMSVPFIDRTHLIVNKRSAGRPQDVRWSTDDDLAAGRPIPPRLPGFDNAAGPPTILVHGVGSRAGRARTTR